VGAAQVFAIEVNKHRRNIAQQMKADWVLDPSKLDPSKEDVNWSVLERTGGLGVDVVLEMAGHPSAIRTAFDIVRRGGRISLLGLTSKPISLNFSEDIIFKGITIQGINGRMCQTWYQMTALLKSGKLDLRPVITDRRSERFFPGDGATEDGRGQQDSGVSERHPIEPGTTHMRNRPGRKKLTAFLALHGTRGPSSVRLAPHSSQDDTMTKSRC